MTDHPDILRQVKELAIRRAEVRAAAAAYPGVELGAAYAQWKAARGESVTPMSTKTTTHSRALSAAIEKLSHRPCTRPDCPGTQKLESVCSGCVEGKAGYKTKWTCSTCMHRDLSKEDINECMTRLSSG